MCRQLSEKVPGIVHVNVTGFASAVAMARDKTLRDKVFVVAEPRAGRAVLLDVSPRAREEGLMPGMALAEAERRFRSLQVLPPEPKTLEKASQEMVEAVKAFAPLIEYVPGGHLYLDLSGTERLFGPLQDTALRIRRNIIKRLNIDPAMALAPNKLTAKVVTRTLRPVGFAAIRRDEAAEFLAWQDIRLLPGVGPVLLKLLHAAGVYTIGDLAVLSDTEASVLLGKQYKKLLDSARGIDAEPVHDCSQRPPSIERQLYFQGAVAEREVLRGSLMALAEEAGMALRQQHLAACALRLELIYGDGVRRVVRKNFHSPQSMDDALYQGAEACLNAALDRRVRVQMIGLRLEQLDRDYGEQDLFIPEHRHIHTCLQNTLDANRRRFGPAILVRGTTLLAQGYAGALPLERPRGLQAARR
ncbi:DNA polymerase [Gracilinema caldarium]|uniref:DNA polymerase Y family protein n=1 Tax=Gracilinema caldarium TaxID=215591 RepID=UPI0026EA8E6C|nr:DNA polymerase [Gracilinema caldarium]